MLNVTEVNATEMLKESSLEAIGYICQDIVSGAFLWLILEAVSTDPDNLVSFSEPGHLGVAE